MKGVIFQTFEEYAATRFNRDQWTKVRQQAGIATPYFIPMADYPDADISALVKATAAEAARSTDDIEREFGHFAIPKFATMYDFYFKPHSTAREFLLKMDEVHQITTQTIAGAKPPHFEYESPSDRSLVMIYSSKRKMCSFVRGLIEGVAQHYKERVRITERCCSKMGAKRCELVIDFSR